MIEPANAEEIQVITTLWIDTFASESERRDSYLRSRISLSAEMILKGIVKSDSIPASNDAWRTLLPMLAAYRAGKRSA